MLNYTFPAIHCIDHLDAGKVVKKGSVDLLLTSTNYPGARRFEVDSEGFLAEWLPARFEAWAPLMKPEGVIVHNIFFPNRVDGWFDDLLFDLPARVYRPLGWRMINPYLWRKTNVVPSGSHVHDYNGFEFCFALAREAGFTCNRQRAPYAEKTTAKAKTGNMRKSDIAGNMGGNGTLSPEGALMDNVIEASSSGDQNRPRAKDGSFPRELADRFILTFSNPDDTVLDPCMGAGTTIVQAMKHGRFGIGLDIDLEECQKAQAWAEQIWAEGFQVSLFDAQPKPTQPQLFKGAKG